MSETEEQFNKQFKPRGVAITASEQTSKYCVFFKKRFCCICI